MPPEPTKLQDPHNPFIVWGQRLLDDPDSALDAILTGRGARGAQQRAEPEDFLSDLLAHPHWAKERDRLMAELDDALLRWLSTRTRWSLAEVNTYGTRAYAAHLAAALAIAARLPLPHTAYQLAEQQPYWDRKFEALRWPGDLDLLLQYDLALIQHQHDTRFAPRWFAACDNAAWGSPYWQSNLTTGLLGLRKLPHLPGSQPERVAAAGLARFGALALDRGMNQKTVSQAFLRRAAALIGLYPRSEVRWQEVWDDVLATLPKTRSLDIWQQLESWLREILASGLGRAESPTGGLDRTDRRQRSSKPRMHRPGAVLLPNREEVDNLIQAIKQASQLEETLWAKVSALIGQYWAYAEATGESHYAVRTVNNLGNQLLRLKPKTEVLETLHTWVVRAIEVEPDNSYSWSFWAKILAALGRGQQSMAVRWECVRRFPNDPAARNELAFVLHRSGHLPMAERLLRETVQDFPGDDVCRNMLAELLRVTDREGEAEEILRQTMKDFQDDSVCRNMLAELLRVTDREGEAEEILRQTMKDFQDDSVCRNTLAELLRVTGREGEAEEILRQTTENYRFQRDAVCRYLLARLLWRRGAYGQAESYLQAAEARDPHNPSIRELAVRIRSDTTQTGAIEETEIPLTSFYLRRVKWGTSLDYAEDFLGAVPLSHPYDETVPGDQARSEESPPTPPSEATATEDPSLPPTADVPPASASPQGIERKHPERNISGPLEDALSNFLARLAAQMQWIEAYFVLDDASDKEEEEFSALRRAAKEGDSELALVALYRHTPEVQDLRAVLDLWAYTRPASYTTRLLRAWDRQAEGSWNAETLNQLAQEFPEHRGWHNWLRLPYLPPKERDELMKDTNREIAHVKYLYPWGDELMKDTNLRGNHGRAAHLWYGRLLAAYPGMDMEGQNGSVAINDDKVRRLVEDVAFACAEKTVAAIPVLRETAEIA